MSNPPLASSEERLWQLIQERAVPGADVAQIDGRIWDLFGQEWAIMFTDLAGFSRGTSEFGITHFLQIIWEQRTHLFPVVERHDGVLVKTDADSMILLFKRPQAALACAIDMQTTCALLNRRRKLEEQILLCVGIGFGQILRIGDHDVFGREVNAAGKLGEDHARDLEILVTEAVREAVPQHPGVHYEPLTVEVPGSDRNWRVRYPLDVPPLSTVAVEGPR